MHAMNARFLIFVKIRMLQAGSLSEEPYASVQEEQSQLGAHHGDVPAADVSGPRQPQDRRQWGPELDGALDHHWRC